MINNGPPYLVYVNTRQFYLCDSLAEALDWKQKTSGILYELAKQCDRLGCDQPGKPHPVGGNYCDKHAAEGDSNILNAIFGDERPNIRLIGDPPEPYKVHKLTRHPFVSIPDCGQCSSCGRSRIHPIHRKEA